MRRSEKKSKPLRGLLLYARKWRARHSGGTATAPSAPRAPQPRAPLRAPRRGRPLRRLRPRAGLAGPAVTQRRHVRPAARPLPPPAPFSARLARRAGNVEREQRTPRPTAIRDAVPFRSRPRAPRRPGAGSPSTRAGSCLAGLTKEPGPGQPPTLGVGA